MFHREVVPSPPSLVGAVLHRWHVGVVPCGGPVGVAVRGVGLLKAGDVHLKN